MNRISNVDSDWAWSRFEPNDHQAWDVSLAAHLYRRAGFSAETSELEAAAEESPADTVDRLLRGGATSTSFQTESESLAETLLAGGNARQLAAWWLRSMLRTPHPLLEKTTLFWHGHFATSAEKVEDARAMYRQNQLLRRYAMGNFAALTHQVARDPAMLIYLDSATNRKSHPNENFARELMELFCLGEGHYSERDVQELARCFTGWEIRRGKFRFNRYQHDTGEKNILGTTGTFPDADAVDVVLAQPEASRFIVGKLIQYFLFDEPTPSPELIEPLAVELREHDWNVGHVIGRMLSSNLFFWEHCIGRKVRSPVEMAVGLLRALEGSTNTVQLAEELVHLGQGLFYPPNVKGWDGGRAWINSSTLLGRANVVGRLVRDEKTRFGGGDLATYFEGSGATTGEAVVAKLEDLLLAVPIPGDARKQLVGLIDRGSGDQSGRIANVIHALSTLPEFHLA